MRRCALDPKHWENIKDVSKLGSCPPANCGGGAEEGSRSYPKWMEDKASQSVRGRQT